MHFLITGHTGFKGAWLTLLLKEREHLVSGFALDPLPGSLFDEAQISDYIEFDIRSDVRDAESVRAAMDAVKPDVVIHMAAQPLVRASYENPRETINTNVLGTLNVVEAIASSTSVQSAVIVTTDKVYQNVNRKDGYVESDALGFADPYSTSKAMADLLTQSWIASFGDTRMAVARAGNVIGGGDVSPDRLLPDIIRAFSEALPVALRYPNAVRPWQHVLDCVNGYLMLTDALLNGEGQGAWNFGPDQDGFRTVLELTETVAGLWGDEASWKINEELNPHEAGLLALDATRAREELGWSEKLDFNSSLRLVVDWHRRSQAGESAREITIAQIRAFEEMTPLGDRQCP